MNTVFYMLSERLLPLTTRRDMEKRAVIEPGRTPEEHPEPQVKTQQQKTAAVADLDNDFRKRAADAVRETTK